MVQIPPLPVGCGYIDITFSVAWQQHDIQELCRVLFDALERQFKKDKAPKANLINELYQGKMKDYVKCLNVSQSCVHVQLCMHVCMCRYVNILIC